MQLFFPVLLHLCGYFFLKCWRSCFCFYTSSSCRETLGSPSRVKRELCFSTSFETERLTAKLIVCCFIIRHCEAASMYRHPHSFFIFVRKNTLVFFWQRGFIRSPSVLACPSHAAVCVPVLFNLCWMTQSDIFLIVLVVRRAISLNACLVRWRPQRGHCHWKIQKRSGLLEDKRWHWNEDEILFLFADVDVRHCYGQNEILMDSCRWL